MNFGKPLLLLIHFKTLASVIMPEFLVVSYLTATSYPVAVLMPRWTSPNAPSAKRDFHWYDDYPDAILNRNLITDLSKSNVRTIHYSTAEILVST
jgi:hypothetical protein